MACRGQRDELAYKPDSVARRAGDHLSATVVTDGLRAARVRPTRRLGRAALRHRLFGLAPGGVYLATPVAWGAGGLLHHRFTLTSRDRKAVCSLWHCPAGRPGWVLPTTLLYGVRTFLSPCGAAVTRPTRPRSVYGQSCVSRSGRAQLRTRTRSQGRPTHASRTPSGHVSTEPYVVSLSRSDTRWRQRPSWGKPS